jgi:hypothetical protein
MHVLEAALVANAINPKRAKRIESEDPQRVERSGPFYKRLSVRALSTLVALIAALPLKAG